MMIHRFNVLLVSAFMTLLLSGAAFAEEPPVPFDQQPKGFLVGQFMVNEKTPLANGRLFIFFKTLGPPSSDRYVRVPDQVEPLDAEGKFSLALPSGTYYLSAIKTPENALPGPPTAGEAVYFKMGLKGEILPFDVTAGIKTDIGIIATSSPFKRNMNSYEAGATMIEGVVVDAEGAPVYGAIILVSLTPGIENMATFVSERTAMDGKFSLTLIDGGDYYLRVRSSFNGGMPKEGDFININDPKEQLLVSVKKGERVSGVVIKVKRQPKRGKGSRQK